MKACNGEDPKLLERVLHVLSHATGTRPHLKDTDGFPLHQQSIRRPF